MKISQRFSLNKSQAELDFIDIDTTTDVALFLDPHFLGQRSDRWSMEATQTLQSFFQKVVDLIVAGKQKDAAKLFEFLHEPNATCLGVSTGNPEGRGVGRGDANKIFSNLLKSKAVQSGLLKDVEDNILFVDNFGKDKLSDMTTNIIRKHLIDYTQRQCDYHGIPLKSGIATGYYWSRNEEQWKTEYSEMLVIDSKPIILVPKGIVSFSEIYTPDKYYNGFILNFLQNEHLNIKSALVKTYKTTGNNYVTKASLKEKHPQTKEFIRNFTAKHPELLDEFKKRSKIKPVKNIEIVDINIKQICKVLGEKLVSIKSGTATANNYHEIAKSILEVLFYPKLINPKKERPIHEGRKRIDITFDNAADDGIFRRFSANMDLPCSYIYVECKNYSSDPENPELDQLSGRFSVNNGKVGLLLCRTIKDRELFIKRCRDTFKDGRGLIIPLADQDLINLLDNHNEMNDSFFEKYFSNLVRDITLG